MYTKIFCGSNLPIEKFDSLTDGSDGNSREGWNHHSCNNIFMNGPCSQMQSGAQLNSSIRQSEICHGYGRLYRVQRRLTR